jgi:hypothetical protein
MLQENMERMWKMEIDEDWWRSHHPDYYRSVRRSEMAKKKREWYQKLRDFRHAIKPAIEIKMVIYNMTPAVLLIYPDGRFESEYRFTPEQQRMLDGADEMIAQIQRTIFGDVPTGE